MIYICFTAFKHPLWLVLIVIVAWERIDGNKLMQSNRESVNKYRQLIGCSIEKRREESPENDKVFDFGWYEET